jgi:hypothetical protein
LDISIRIAGQQPIGSQKGMGSDQEVGQLTLWRPSTRAPATNGISGKAGCRHPPDIFSEVEINSDGHFPERFPDKMHIQPGDGRELDEDGRAYPQRPLRVNS